jgi:hypothetical protein
MRIPATLIAASAVLILSGCGTSGGLYGRSGPDEFAVTRNAPLVVPPDFALTPPQPGQTVPAAVDSRAEAISTLFGGPAPRSQAEQKVLSEADRTAAAPGARSIAGDPGTTVVDKGAVTRTILTLPEGDGQEARTQTPQ